MKRLMLVATVTSLSACLPSSIQVYRSDLTKEARADLFYQDLERAEHFVGEGHLLGCLAVFRARMHDPDSFEIATLPEIDKINSDYTWGKSLYEGQPLRLITFSGAVRGNNRFGGKVLTEISCRFNISDTEATFYEVIQR